MIRIARALLALFAGAAAAPSIGAEPAYPARAIHWVVPYPPGGTTDVVARSVAQQMSQRLGVPIVVDNKGGAGGTIGMAFVAKADPDGYTLLVSDASIATAPALYKSLSFDVAKELVPIERFATVPHVLVVNPSLPVRNVADLVALAKSRPAKLDFASGGIGSPLHLAGEAFRAATGITWTHVPYRGAGPAIMAVIGGETQVAMPSLPSALPQIAAGRLRALAVTGPSRVAGLPDVPSMTELGWPDAVVAGWIGLHGPRGMPAAAAVRLQQAAAEALAVPAVRKVLQDQGADVDPLGAIDYGRVVASESARWKRLVDAVGIVLD